MCVCACISVKRVFVQVLHLCFSRRARGATGTKSVEKWHPIVSFIFTLVERRAIQTLLYYPAADASLSCELPLKTILLKNDSLFTLLGNFSNSFHHFLTLMQEPNSAQLTAFLNMDANEALFELIRRPISNPVNNTMAYCGWIS